MPPLLLPLPLLLLAPLLLPLPLLLLVPLLLPLLLLAVESDPESRTSPGGPPLLSSLLHAAAATEPAMPTSKTPARLRNLECAFITRPRST
jgi:hypothetical protein